MPVRVERRRQKRDRSRRRDRAGDGNSIALRWWVLAGAITTGVLVFAVFSLWPRQTPALAFDKLHVDLGTVARDQEGTQTFLVMNRGDEPLEVGPVDIVVEQGCDEVEVGEHDPEVQPGEHMLLPISLGPHRMLGPHRVLLNFQSNDHARPITTLSMQFDVEEETPSGTGGPRLRVDKEIIDTGVVPYDRPLYEQFTLRNAGDAPLVLNVPMVVGVERGC